MWSMKPYWRACSAVYQWSCSESSCTVSNGCPVSSAIRASTVSRMCRRSLAWISISTADPPIPADPWCISTRACRSAYRLPGVPADSRNCPALQASPIASVDTSHGTSRITSRIASIDGTEPPSEWIHNAMSRSGSSAARVRICVASKVPLSSSSVPSSTTIRCPSNRCRADSLNSGALLSSAMSSTLTGGSGAPQPFCCRQLCPEQTWGGCTEGRVVVGWARCGWRRVGGRSVWLAAAGVTTTRSSVRHRGGSRGRGCGGRRGWGRR